MSPKGILSLKIYGAMIGLVVLVEWIQAPETILPTIALPFIIYFGYHLLKALWLGIYDIFGAVFFREQRKREAEERLRQEKVRFEKLEAERKEAERLERLRAEERRLLTSPNQIAGLFTYTYMKIYDRLGVEIVSYNGFNEHNVTIPESIGNHPVIRIGEKAFTNAKIHSVSCPDSVIEIGENAFKSCTELKKIKLSASLKKIGEYAFAYCEKLESVILPEGLEKMDMCAFAYSGICEIHFPSTLKEIPYACCCDCVNLTYVQIEHGVKKIGGKAFGSGFRKANKIQSIVIPESVTIVGNNAFDGSRAAIAFRGMHTNGEKVEQYSFGTDTHSIGGGIYYVLSGSAMQRFAREHMHECRSLSDFKQISGEKERQESENKASGIDKSKTELMPEKAARVNVTKSVPLVIGEVFSYQPCSIAGKHGVEITSYNGFDEHRIDIPENLEGRIVIRIADKAFESLDVEQVCFPDSLLEIGSYAFSGCKKLKNVAIPKEVKKIESNAFANCEQLERMVLPDGIELLGEFLFAYTGITKIAFPASLEEIPVGCCQNCMKLTEVTLNNGIQRIKAKAFAQPVFYKGNSVGNALSSLLIPESVELIETDAFLNREGIQLAFLGMKTTALEEKRMSYECISQRKAVFYGRESSEIQAYAQRHYAQYRDISEYCGHRRELVKSLCPSPITTPKLKSDESAWESDGRFAFRNCRIGNLWGLEIVSYVRRAGQKEIEIPDSIHGQSVLKLGKSLFESCEVEKIVCPETLLVIDESAFAKSAKLREIRIPCNIREIGARAFMACTSLEYVRLPDGLMELGAYAFAHSRIKEIQFPSSLEEIPEACCLNCLRLEKVSIEEGVKRIGNHAFAISDLNEAAIVELDRVEIPESVKTIGYDAFKQRNHIAIAVRGMDTTGEGKIASSSSMLYVRPGSMMQKYARRNKLPMKPLAEHEQEVTRRSGKKEETSYHDAENQVIPGKEEYIRRTAGVLNSYIKEQTGENAKDRGSHVSLSDKMLFNKEECIRQITALLKCYVQKQCDPEFWEDSYIQFSGNRITDDSCLPLNASSQAWRYEIKDSRGYARYMFSSEMKAVQGTLAEEKHLWRDRVEDGWEFGVDPKDYETEEEYLDALNEEKYAWRDTAESGWEHGVAPEDFETEEEYMEALNEEKYSWRDMCVDNDHGIDPEEYETEEEYETAVEEADDGEW